MYKKFAIVVLLLAPVLTMVASRYTPSKHIDAQTASDMAPMTENTPEQIAPQPIEMAQPVVEEPSNGVAIASAPSAGIPMLDPKGIDPTPALFPGGAAPPPPRVEDVTPDAPPSVSPHDEVDTDRPPGV